MNKTIIALALAGVCLSANAAKKDKKVAKAEQPVEVAEVKVPVELVSEKDSVSYAAGQMFTNGLNEYIKSQLGVEEGAMNYFLEGLNAGLSRGDNPADKARAAGEQIASMVLSRMMPQVQTQLEGTRNELDVELFKRGFLDAVTNDASVLSAQESTKYFEQKSKEMKAEKDEALKAEGTKFLEENAKKPGVKVLPSGLQYKVVREGNGPVATADQEVVVKYEGRLINGKVFDSSYTRTPDTTTFKPTQVIKGWTEALTMMPAGSEWELYIPYNLAYGERGAGKDIPAFSALIFKVEVVEVKAKEAEKAEAQPAVAPAPAKKTAATTAKKPVAKKKK